MLVGSFTKSSVVELIINPFPVFAIYLFLFMFFFQLRSQVPEGMCVCVPCTKIRQQTLALMRYFNVKVKSQDIFSRCQVITLLLSC